MAGTTFCAMSAQPQPWSGEPVFRVDRPVMTQEWRQLAAIHWRVEPGAIEQLLPSGLEADVFDGSGWVGLIPFQMANIAASFTPPIPYFGSFPETNIRTYVTGASGPGIYFHSLDISRLAPVLVARMTYRLPYMWSAMSIAAGGNQIEYRARRRWPGPRRVRSEVAIAIGDPIDEPTQLEHFLSARWGLYTMLGRRLSFAKVEHEPWPLHRATLKTLDDGLLGAAGYGHRGEPDHVMYSPGVAVRIERPRFVTPSG
jgi:uncharacterized protein YqjF (DUF2071 family)